MIQSRRSAGVTIATVLLGVTAVGAAAFGLFAPVIALGAADLLGGPLGSVAKAVIVVIGLASLLFAAGAAVAARMVQGGRQAGAVAGTALGAILVAGPAVAAASGGWHPTLLAAIALGVGVIGSLATSFPASARS